VLKGHREGLHSPSRAETLTLQKSESPTTRFDAHGVSGPVAPTRSPSGMCRLSAAPRPDELPLGTPTDELGPPAPKKNTAKVLRLVRRVPLGHCSSKGRGRPHAARLRPPGSLGGYWYSPAAR